MKWDVEYVWDTIPTSEEFQVFKVLGGCIWQIINPKAYYIDNTLEWDYFYMDFIDPVTAEIICKYLNENVGELNR